MPSVPRAPDRDRPAGRPRSRPLYRARQFFAALRPSVGREERERAAAVLGEGLLPLFDSMSARDRRHCLDVFHSLRRDGCGDPDLLAAALLHDAGKGRLAGVRVGLWHRVAYVLLAAASPRRLERLARPGGPFDGLRAGLRALHHHAERGAELAAAFGATPATAELIRRHEARDPADPRLRPLQAADDAC